MPFVDFKLVSDRQETHRIIDVPEWGGQVRINRLDANEVLNIVEMQDDFEKGEDGELLNQMQAMEFAVELCAKTIANESGELQYDNPSGREFLALEFTAVKRICEEATDLHKLVEKPEAKKNE